jgi:TonB family protein
MNADKIGLAFVAYVGLCLAAEAPKPIRFELVEYPRMAHIAGVQGSAELNARISELGQVKATKVVSGDRLFAKEAEKALKLWRFTPCSGDELACTARVKFVFVLQGQCSSRARIDECRTEFRVDSPAQVTIHAKRIAPMID